MDKYRRVEKAKQEPADIKENEIRITTQGKMRNYISYATNLLTDPNKQAAEIVLKAMGRAINKTVTIAEIIKRRVPGLHQNTQIDSTEITDVWEPLEEGLHRLENVRHVSSIQVTLSTQPLDQSLPGYQPPIPADQVKPLSADFGDRPPRRPRGRGGRGGYGGRGRGGRGGHGGQGPSQPPVQQFEEPPAPIAQAPVQPPPEQVILGGGEERQEGGGRPYGRRGRGGRGGFRGFRGGYNENRGRGGRRGGYNGGEGQAPQQNLVQDQIPQQVQHIPPPVQQPQGDSGFGRGQGESGFARGQGESGFARGQGESGFARGQGEFPRGRGRGRGGRGFFGGRGGGRGGRGRGGRGAGRGYENSGDA